MSLRSSYQIQEGDIIEMRDGSRNLYYIQGIEMKLSNGEQEIQNFIALPIIDLPNDEDNEAGIVTITRNQIKDRDHSIRPHEFLGVSLNAGIHRISPDSEEVEQFIGSCPTPVKERINGLYQTMGLSDQRIGDLPTDTTSVRGMDWGTIAHGGVAGAVPLDGEIPDKEPKREHVKKAKSLVKVPDIYLEEAIELGLLSEETYKTLQADRENIVTLRDAWALAQNTGSKPLSKLSLTSSFDTTFPPEEFHRKGSDTFTDDSKVSENPVVQYTEAQGITLADAVERKLITQKTAEILFNQTDEDSDYDERSITDLEEAFRLVACDPEYLSEYDSPVIKQNRQLTKKQQEVVIEDVKGAFDKLASQAVIATTTNDINAAMKQFGEIMMDKVIDGSAFMRHDPNVEVKRNIEKQRDTEISKIKTDRPPALTA